MGLLERFCRRIDNDQGYDNLKLAKDLETLAKKHFNRLSINDNETATDVYTELENAVFRPILFSTPMVQAILEGRKTQTRRLQGLKEFNESPDCFRYDGTSAENESIHYFETIDIHGKPTERYTSIESKVKIGDVFWVRETWGLNYFGSSQFWHLKDSRIEVRSEDFIYKATSDDLTVKLDDKWKPSIFMPKKACRIFLEVINVRVERLKDISKDDAIAEGILSCGNNDGTSLAFYDYSGKTTPDSFNFSDPIFSFKTLWQSINSKNSWKENPFVFVYDFKRIERPLSFC